MKITLISKKNIHISLKKWSDKWWYFEITEEIEEANSQFYNCRVLKRTLPIYNLEKMNKLLKGDRYKRFFNWRAEKLWSKYADQ